MFVYQLYKNKATHVMSAYDTSTARFRSGGYFTCWQLYGFFPVGFGALNMPGSHLDLRVSIKL